jgi:hypothetical protein
MVSIPSWFPHGFNAVSRTDTPSIVRSYDDAPCTAVDLVRIPLAIVLHARNGKLCAFKFAPWTVVHRISGQSDAEYHRPGLQSCRRLNLIPLSASVVAQIRLFQVSTQSAAAKERVARRSGFPLKSVTTVRGTCEAVMLSRFPHHKFVIHRRDSRPSYRHTSSSSAGNKILPVLRMRKYPDYWRHTTGFVEHFKLLNFCDHMQKKNQPPSNSLH